MTRCSRPGRRNRAPFPRERSTSERSETLMGRHRHFVDRLSGAGRGGAGRGGGGGGRGGRGRGGGRGVPISEVGGPRDGGIDPIDGDHPALPYGGSRWSALAQTAE